MSGLQQLADEALAGSVEQVVCLDAPEWPPLPDYIRRELDGRGVYTRPGATRYATRVQLAMEEQLLQEAQRQGAPHLTRCRVAFADNLIHDATRRYSELLLLLRLAAGASQARKPGGR